MEYPLLCPRCKSNRTRFNKIEQHSVPMKLDAISGHELEDYNTNQDPFYKPYTGSEYLIQCVTCGNVEEELVYQRAAEMNPPGQFGK